MDSGAKVWLGLVVTDAGYYRVRAFGPNPSSERNRSQPTDAGQSKTQRLITSSTELVGDNVIDSGPLPGVDSAIEWCVDVLSPACSERASIFRSGAELPKGRLQDGARVEDVVGVEQPLDLMVQLSHARPELGGQ